jgi:anti-sigma factor RsiW
MACHEVENLSLFLDGELSAAEATRVQQHVTTCAGCAAELDELRAMTRLLSAARSSSMGGMPDEAMDRLRLHVQGLIESTDAGLLRIARVFTGLAASILIAGIWLLSQPTETPKVEVATSGWQRAAITLSVDPTPTTMPDIQSPEAVLADLSGLRDWEAELP